MESTAQYWKPVWETLERYWQPLRRQMEGSGLQRYRFAWSDERPSAKPSSIEGFQVRCSRQTQSEAQVPVESVQSVRFRLPWASSRNPLPLRSHWPWRREPKSSVSFAF